MSSISFSTMNSVRVCRARCTRTWLQRRVQCQSAMSTDGAVSERKQEIDMKSLPALRGLPIIGMAKYFSDHDMDLKDLHKEHGTAFLINFGIVMGGWNLALSDDKSVKEVVMSDDKRFISSWPEEYIRLLSPWTRRAHSAQEQNEWKKLMLSILSKENVFSLQLPLMVHDVSKRLREHALAEVRRIAFGVASRTSMGALLSDEDVDEYFEIFNTLTVNQMANFGLRDGLPGTAYHTSVKARKKIEAKLYPRLLAALKDPSVLEGETSGVARMVRAIHEEASEYIPTDAEYATSNTTGLAIARGIARYIAGQTFFLMFVGTDTTSNALQQMVIHLNRHPQWLPKLQQEQDRLRAEFGDTLDRKVLSRSAVATAIAQEVLRLKTPVRSAFRTAARDTTVQGIRVPKGTHIIASLQMPTKRTGTDGFNPAQWLNDDETQARLNDTPSNLVWGSGPRRCAGQNLATVEIIACLAIIGREIERFDVVPDKNDHDYYVGPDHPTGFPLTMVPRAR